MPFKVLEDSWKDAKQGIEELERDGRVLVSRTTVASTSTREPQIKMVFMDEVGKIDPPIEKGELGFSLSFDFVPADAVHSLHRRMDVTQDACPRGSCPRAASRCVFAV